jgi:hypothetical protein
LMEEAAGGVKAVEEAMAEAEKHASRSKPLAALVAEAKGLIEQARAAEAERASLAAEEAAAAAAELQQLDEDLAAATLRLQQVQLAASHLVRAEGTMRCRGRGRSAVQNDRI